MTMATRAGGAVAVPGTAYLEPHRTAGQEGLIDAQLVPAAGDPPDGARVRIGERDPLRHDRGGGRRVEPARRRSAAQVSSGRAGAGDQPGSGTAWSL